MNRALLPARPRPTAFRRLLARWYVRHGRHSLPWRGRFDPYRILVSEFMLQQTTVRTVLPYFHRFMRSFPRLRRLAAAPLERVLQQWSGLGYYARARNLHRTARILMEHHNGRLPQSRGEVESLPGIGPYTAGALLSFAHDQPEPLVDGNVVRVLSRVFGLKGETGNRRGMERVWTLARSLVPDRGSRHYHSALMDFGATVCRPALPDCGACPLDRTCWAYRNRWVDRLPRLRKDAAKRPVRWTALAVERRGRFYFKKRPLRGLWGGLWDLPGFEGPPEGSMVRITEGTAVLGRRLAGLRHILSHRDIRVELWSARPQGPWRGGSWKTPSQAQAMAVSSLTKKLLSVLDSGSNRLVERCVNEGRARPPHR